jgi:hypothetical protein
MSFVFKTLERLTLWHLEETVLADFPMHMNQHAFRKGRSTESALSDTVDHLESAALNGGVAIGVFLDIEGAFDNLMPEGLFVSSRREQVHNESSWLKNPYLGRIPLIGLATLKLFLTPPLAAAGKSMR